MFATDPFNRPILVGTTGVSLVVTRCRANGVLDPSFDGDGRAVIDIVGDTHRFAGVAANQTRIYTGGRLSLDLDATWVVRAVDQQS